jgi:hypothetical protein
VSVNVFWRTAASTPMPMPPITAMMIDANTSSRVNGKPQRDVAGNRALRDERRPHVAVQQVDDITAELLMIEPFRPQCSWRPRNDLA